MNPETGTFHPIREDAAEAAKQIATGEIGKDWPVFAVGQVIDIRGYEFIIWRINRSSLVLRPIPTRGYSSPQKLLRLMTGNDT